MEDNRGILAKIFNPENIGGGPNMVMLPHPQRRPKPRTAAGESDPASSKP